MGEFGRVVRAGAGRILVGACVDVGGSEVPYAPLLGALRSLVRETDADQLAELVGAGGGTEAAGVAHRPGLLDAPRRQSPA